MDNKCKKDMGPIGLGASYDIKGKRHSKYHIEWLQLYESGGCATRPGSPRGFQVGQDDDNDKSQKSSEVDDDRTAQNIALDGQYTNSPSSHSVSETIYARYEAALKRVEALLPTTATKKGQHKANHPRLPAGVSSKSNPWSVIGLPPYRNYNTRVEPQPSFNPVAANASSVTIRSEVFQKCGCLESESASRPIGNSRMHLSLPSIQVCSEPVAQPAAASLSASNLSYRTGAAKTGKRVKSASHGHLCKRPVIVVPAGEGVSMPRCKHDHKMTSTEIDRQNRSKLNLQLAPPNVRTDNRQDLPSCSFCPQDQQTLQPQIRQQQTTLGRPVDLGFISEISKQLNDLNWKLDRLQRTEIFDIRHQMDSLSANVKSLNQKLQDEGMNTDTPDCDCCPAEQQKNIPNVNSSAQVVRTPRNVVQPCPGDPRRNAMDVKDRSSSSCEFCRDKNLPVLNSFHRQLLALIGNLKFSEVLMSILLRRDNVYHVRVQDMIHDRVLGCFLVSDAGIEEAIRLGVFEQTMTFSVIDVRNTLKPRKCGLGIAFEYSNEKRECD